MPRALQKMLARMQFVLKKRTQKWRKIPFQPTSSRKVAKAVCMPSHNTRPQREKGACAERSAQASTLKPSQESKPPFETLIGSPEAAKLLGNIHVKTLQRYARTGSLPGYQIGGHWYFRVSELDAWPQSRINSNCQPADRVDFTQEKTQ
jgi:excisionase family DNA binding protein